MCAGMTPVAASGKKEDRKASATAGLPAQSAVGESCAPDSYVQAPQGLFPAPLHPNHARGSRTVERFRCLGRVMAKALQDSRLLDIPFSYTFYRCARTLPCPSPSAHMADPVRCAVGPVVPACEDVTLIELCRQINFNHPQYDCAHYDARVRE